MRPRRLLLALSPLALVVPLLAASNGSPEIAVERDVRIPMRDGVRLAADVYRPAQEGRPLPGRFPVVLERTPYDKGQLDGYAEALVRRGYVFIAQNVRGRYGSEGRFRPHRDDGPDGFDTAAWIAAQPWSDGGIGMTRTSWDGGTQHAMALANPPALKALVPIDAMSNGGRFGIRHQGAMELRFLNWILNFGFAPAPVRQPGIAPDAGEPLSRLRDEVTDYARHLPLRPGTTPLALAPDYEAWLVAALFHGGNDAFWRDMGSAVADHVAEYKDIPVYHVGGWYDSWAHGTADLNYATLARAKRGPHKLVMGPWTHGGQEESSAARRSSAPPRPSTSGRSTHGGSTAGSRGSRTASTARRRCASSSWGAATGTARRKGGSSSAAIGATSTSGRSHGPARPPTICTATARSPRRRRAPARRAHRRAGLRDAAARRPRRGHRPPSSSASSSPRRPRTPTSPPSSSTSGRRRTTSPPASP
jgi:predicted acyl esterase